MGDVWGQIGSVSTSISVLIGLATWLVTHLWDRRCAKVAHTANLISDLSTCEGLAAADYFVTTLVNAGRPVGKAELDDAGERHVTAILNYYEYVCDACVAGVVDRRTIVNLRGKLMRRTWLICEPYVTAVRDLQRRRIYSEFERFTGSLPVEESYVSPVPPESVPLKVA